MAAELGSVAWKGEVSETVYRVDGIIAPRQGKVMSFL